VVFNRLKQYRKFFNQQVRKILPAIIAAAFVLLQASDQFPRPLRLVQNPGLENFGLENTGIENHGSGADLKNGKTEDTGNSGPSLIKPGDLDRELVQYYINQYCSPGGKEWLRAVMEKAAPYIGFIKEEIAERGLPQELAYLPVIESGYLAGAVSKSGAMGLWQFMKNSIAGYDLKINEWMDERRDFWKSTDAALKKLEENYNYLGDWSLALAAYNAGLGAMTAAIKNSGIRDYWVLSQKHFLKTETIHYVPKLLAAAHILSNPRQYGIIIWNPQIEWTRIATDRSVDLNILAKEAQIDAAELKKANQELTYSITPPDKNYLLKIRVQDAEKAAAVLARKDLPLVKYYIHTIRSGDTLLALALSYGITVDQITALNPGIEPRLLRIGTTLMIPAVNDQPPPAVSKPGENIAFTGTHLVIKGESLWSIALSYGIDPEALAEANGMELNGILREGRMLKTPIRE